MVMTKERKKRILSQQDESTEKKKRRIQKQREKKQTGPREKNPWWGNPQKAQKLISCAGGAAQMIAKESARDLGVRLGQEALQKWGGYKAREITSTIRTSPTGVNPNK